MRHLTSLRLFFCIFVCVIVLSFAGCKISKEAQIDGFFVNYSGKAPGAVVMVIKNGNPVFKKAYGLASMETNELMRTFNNLRLASMTKQFTATCITMLVERGKLTYMTTLKDIFPDFPDYGNSITVWHLLHHSSGLIAYEDLIPDTATVQVHDKDVLTMMMQQDSTYFSPGTKYRYSNTGYAVLAMIVEKSANMPFAEFLKKNIFDPLEMTGSVAYEKGISTVRNRAYGYAVADDHFVFRDQSLTSAVLGDGGIYSNVSDLFKWDQALYTDRLISKSSFTKATTPDTLADGTVTGYGFGWRIDMFHGHKRMHHTGGTSGFSTIIQRYPDDHFTVLILTNRDQPSVAPIADKIAELYLL